MTEQPTQAVPTPMQFFTDTVAPRFAAVLREAEQRLDELASEVADLRAASGAICWEVESMPPVHLAIGNGNMRVAPGLAQDPFMSVRLNAADWRRFASGAVRLGFFESGGKRRFGRSRIERLSGLRGTVRVVFTGMADGDWSCVVAFGRAAAAEPQAVVSIASEAVAKMQSGQLDPQSAFMMGHVRISGDTGFVMQLGMAMFM